MAVLFAFGDDDALVVVANWLAIEVELRLGAIVVIIGYHLGHVGSCVKMEVGLARGSHQLP